MNIENYNIEQCDAVSVLNSIMDMHDRPQKIDTIYNGLAPIIQEYTQGKQAIVNALQGYGVECSMDETLTELAGKINQTGLSVEDVVFSNPQDNKLANLLLTPSLVTSIKSSKQFTIGDYGPLYPFSGLRRIELSGVTAIGPAGYLSREFTCLNVVEVLIFQNLITIYNGDGSGFGNSVKIFDFGYVTARGGGYSIISLSSGNRTLRHWKSGGWFPVGYRDTINYATCLYDVSFRNVLQSSKDCSTWRPTEALRQGTLLLEKDEWDDPNEPTETFTCNKDKFKWYFENHFLPCFAVVAEGSSATPTLTLYTTVYNFANTEYTAADPTKTYIDVLTDRGWTVASAS